MTAHAFHAFYQAHIDKVYKYIYFRVGGNRQVAEDLTSEVFLKAVEHREALDLKKGATAWIMTVARNRLKNYYRDTRPSVDVEDVALTLVGEDGRHTLQEQSDAREVEGLLQKLDAETRALIEWRYLAGYTFGEIAERLKSTPGAIRVRCHRALKQLRSLRTL